jgi:hypothetical protein
MHLAFRFLHDKLIGHAFTDIINTEFNNPAAGMKAIQDILHASPLNMKTFKFYSAKSKDESADGAFTWATPKLDKCLQIGAEMEFKHLYTRNPARGALLQAACRKFVYFWKRMQVWPGDGDSNLTKEKIFEQHSNFLEILTTEAEGVPGSDGVEMVGLPLSIITPCAHMWANHVGEQFEASKALGKYFQNPLGRTEGELEAKIERRGKNEWGGGLNSQEAMRWSARILLCFTDIFKRYQDGMKQLSKK